MKKDNRIYLVHMLETAQRITRRVAGLTRAQFDANEDVQLALTHLLQMIGEAARLVSPDTRLAVPGLPWKEITGMRHRLVHDYLNVNLDLVWEAAIQDAPVVISELQKALQQIGDPRLEADPED